MKIIDLLNKIANNEEVPKKIALDKKIFQFNKTYEQYHDKYEVNLLEHISDYNYSGLNDEIEIIEEKPKKIEDLRKEMSKFQSEIDLLSNEIGSYHNKIHSMRDRNNYMKETLKDLLKTVNYLLEKESDK